MAVLKLSTPGVFVQEIASLPPSIAEVETAIPAFIGYTEKAEKVSPGDLKMIANKINNLEEYIQFYGKASVEAVDSIYITLKSKGSSQYDVLIGEKQIKPPDPLPPAPPLPDSPLYHLTDKAKYNMYYSIKHFYENQGGTCYIISVDTYATSGVVDKDQLLAGLKAVEDIDEVTILVVPEATKIDDPAAVNLSATPPAPPAAYKAIVNQMISQASSLKDRFALVDPFIVTPKNSTDPNGDIDKDVAIIRDATLTFTENSYAAAYYPNLISAYSFRYNADADPTKNIDLLKINKYIWSGSGTDPNPVPDNTVIGTLKGSVLYNKLDAELKRRYVVLPPSPAIAGLYTKVDSTKGVWKAPANESLLSVVAPEIAVSNREQENLNVDPNSGKSINVIRTFPGYGTLVWGARTLNGNDNEWKYISVRRFFNMVEESIKKSSQWAVFEPNTISTWVKISAMIENYLFVKWRDGALAGSKPEQAFYVRVGLGTTMTAFDILEGRMNVEIGMAVSRPAEFIVLKFTQLMQQA
jgi:phage tail sheath protein FI